MVSRLQKKGQSKPNNSQNESSGLEEFVSVFNIHSGFLSE